MLEEINAKYKSNLSLEDVLSKIKFVNRMKTPFVAVNMVAYALSIVTFIMSGLEDPNELYLLYMWAIFLSVIFFLEAIGFLYFGRRLVNVMPDNIKQNMGRVRKGYYLYHWREYMVYSYHHHILYTYHSTNSLLSLSSSTR